MTAVAQRCLTYLVLGALLLALVLYVFHRIDGILGGDQDAQTTIDSRAQIKVHGTLVKVRAHLQQVERDKATLALSFLALSDALRDSTPPPVTAGDSGWKRIADLTRSGATACFTALTACQQRATLAEQEAESLTVQLGRQTKVRDHPWGVWLGAGYGTAGRLEVFVGLGRRLLRLPWF